MALILFFSDALFVDDLVEIANKNAIKFYIDQMQYVIRIVGGCICSFIDCIFLCAWFLLQQHGDIHIELIKSIVSNNVY